MTHQLGENGIGMSELHCSGHYSHGLNRLDMYVNDIKFGTTAKEGLTPDLIESRTSSEQEVHWSLNNHRVRQYCMDLAMEKAKTVGIGLVAARRSNHFGIAGYYSLRATDKNLIGWAVRTHSPPLNRSRNSDLSSSRIRVHWSYRHDRKCKPWVSWTVERNAFLK
jgi:hypothetical protein